VITQISANQNDGPVPLMGAVTMYSTLTQIVRLNESTSFQVTCLNE
jgi:hypothetical protein